MANVVLFCASLSFVRDIIEGVDTIGCCCAKGGDGGVVVVFLIILIGILVAVNALACVGEFVI